MMRSLSSAVTGLRSHQTKMDVIGNNIANVNTNGFKASRTTFADVYYQNLSGSKAGVQGSTGGTNPTQIGYGASVATIDVLNNVTGAASTDRALDVYITGEGFLVSKDPSGQLLYSRLGNLGFDAAGNLIDGSGNLIMGFPTDADGHPVISPDGTILADQLQGINCDPEILEKLTGISINNSGAIIGMLEGDPTISAQSNIPNWLNGVSMSIPTTSVYNGPVKFAMSGFCTNDDMATALGIPGAVTSIEMGTLALPAGADYKVSVNEKGVVTVHRPKNETEGTEAVTLTGSLKDGKLVLANKNGDIGLIVNVDTSVSGIPSTVTPGTAAQVIPNDGTGGTTLEYDENPTAGGVYYEAYDNTGAPLPIGTTTPAIVKGVPASNTAAADLSNPLFEPDGAGGWKAIEDASGNPLYAAYTTTTIPGTNPVTNESTLPMELYYQMKTTDKGGNAIAYPEEPMKLTDANTAGTYPWTVTGLDELGLEMLGTPTGPFNGIIGTAGPSEGTSFVIGNLALAKFRNANGLQQTGTSYFTETNNSGTAEFVVPGLSGTGALKAGYLEMSNVDVSKEFTDMITTQRGFQANSRIITVSDEMLQELVNLKR